MGSLWEPYGKGVPFLRGYLEIPLYGTSRLAVFPLEGSMILKKVGRMMSL